MASSNGLTRSKSASDAPTMKSDSPLSAWLASRPTGASTNDIPLAVAAADSWHQQLTTLLGTQLAARTVVHSDEPLSLSVTTDSGTGFEIVFRGEPRRCTTTGCHAVADLSSTEPEWRSAAPDAAVLDHDHQPSYPFDSPPPGTWTAH